MKKNAPFLGIIALLTCLFLWIACQKNANTVTEPPLTTQELGGTAPTPVDTVSPNPIYNITDSCGVTCLAGSCGRKATFDGRYCKLVCKCGGVLGGYPQCDLVCKFPTPTPTTPTPGTGPGAARQYSPQTISYVLEANAAQLQVQAGIIASMKTSRLKNAGKVVTELQEIYKLFNDNKGKLTGVNAEKYASHLTKALAWHSEQ